MQKLIAQRPIQYLGRAYERGAALPANDPLMTEAWLKAGSAAWEETNQETVTAASQEAARSSKVNDMTADAIRTMGITLEDSAGEFVGKEELARQLVSVPPAETQAAAALRAMGVELTDEAGCFVGEERLKEQLCSLIQELLPDYRDVLPAAENFAGGALPEEDGKILDTDPDGHFSLASLSRLTKAELLDLAEDLGVDLSGCRTNAERVEVLAAVDAAAILEAGSSDALPKSLPPETPA